jgi:hypothetical protein
MVVLVFLVAFKLIINQHIRELQNLQLFFLPIFFKKSLGIKKIVLILANQKLVNQFLVCQKTIVWSSQIL